MIDRNKLIFARSLLKAGHVKGILAADEHGQSCPVAAPQARSWCALGALLAVHESDAPGHANQMPHEAVGKHLAAYLPIKELSPPLPRGAPGMRRVVDWNNHPDVTQADVVSLFDRAIDALPNG